MTDTTAETHDTNPTGRRLVAAGTTSLLAAGLLVGVVPPAHAQDSAVVAVNTKDGTDLSKAKFKLRKVSKDIVDTGNAAVAVSSCVDCSTTAISFQVVLASGDPSSVETVNLAIALNESCTTCQTVAQAYQFVVASSGDDKIRLTDEGKDRLKAVKKAVKDLESGEYTIEELQVRLDAIADEIRDVLRTQIVRDEPVADAAEPAPAVEPVTEAEPVAAEEPAEEPAEAITTTEPAPTDVDDATVTEEPAAEPDATTTEPEATATTGPEPTTGEETTTEAEPAA